ncbi:hypothetical protein B0J13DRAFT_560166 [Dactylonectria estremocensis]|uniref:Uncharacterized protein n=1 Tax=Dactylonectria estremocensis TaxID=1079267 RepID=A0A9P9J0B4_9HYPO|nr:hypothetical protein B0J13DRAFT_560166 [Dactylonectria estremocensis]
MADRVRIRYTFKGIEQFEEFVEPLRKIIEEDSGQEQWIETRSLPPIGFPPPLSTEAVEKLKKLAGVNVEELQDD